MNIHDMTEVAYKNGYEAGKKEAQDEIEKLTVELVGIRGACESYKMHYENAKAEIERLQIRNKTLTDISKNYDWKFAKVKLEAIKEFADNLCDEINQIDTSKSYDDKDDIVEQILFKIDNLVKEMTEQRGEGK